MSRSQFKANLGQKGSKTLLILTNKLGMVGHTCDPSYKGGLWSNTGPDRNARPHLKNNQSKKVPWLWLKW
jgi:hypothetical protein